MIDRSKKAAYIATLEEGPFLEQAIHGCCVFVDKVFVVECMKTWSGADAVRRGRTKAIVEKCGVHNVEYVENPTGRVDGHATNTETAQRNWAMEVIESRGYEWVWIVDADEVYTQTEASNLWDWFERSLDGNHHLLGARVRWYTYWRSLNWAAYPLEPFSPTVILRSSCRFEKVRVMSREAEMRVANVPQDVCMVHHFSWSRRPVEIKKKIDCGSEFGRSLVPGWFDEKFLKWSPGEGGTGYHPTEPHCYEKITARDWELPEAIQRHPWARKEVIEDCRIKVIILNHMMPENTDKLAEQLKTSFPEVEVWDSGSSGDGIPMHLTESFGNIYWEGAWEEAMRRYSDYDAVWIIGCDIELKSSPERCRQAIESSVPFGCWSPSIEGRAHPFMKADKYNGERKSVKNVEGMCLAVSGELIRAVGSKFQVKTKIGFGQDYWFSAMARKHGMSNYIDGAVKVHHPASIGYSEGEAHNAMEHAFSQEFGADFRRTLFEYDESFEGNLLKETDMSEEKVDLGAIQEPEPKTPLVIATVDNGWGVKDFEKITKGYDCRRIIMRKGVSKFESETTAEVIDYDPEMKQVLDADIALFTRVGASNEAEYRKMFEAGIPMVVQVSHQRDLISHEENGYLFGHETWARGWIEKLLKDEGLRLRIGGMAASGVKKSEPEPEKKEETPKESPKEAPVQEAKPEPVQNPSGVKVTIITPTWKRDPKIVSHCIDCVRLQTVKEVEQLVCSDGEPEAGIASLVGSVGDDRISYHNTIGKKPGDYGNTVRSEMLKRAKGDYVLFMDDDNLILPNYLEKMIAAIEESGKDFAVCRVVHFGPLREDVIGRPPQVLTGLPVKLHYVDPLQILVKREAMLEIGWDTEKGYLADGHTLQALGEKFEHVEVQEILGYHM